MSVQLSSEDGAKQLQLAFDSARLSIRDVQARFNSRVLDTGDDADRRGSMSKTPDALAAEVLDYMVCSLHPLTFQCFTLFLVFHEQIEIPVSRTQRQRQVREDYSERRGAYGYRGYQRRSTSHKLGQEGQTEGLKIQAVSKAQRHSKCRAVGRTWWAVQS
jgi:hypothetical protein